MANMSAKFMKNAFIGWTDTCGLYYPPDYDPSKVKPIRKEKSFKQNEGKKGGLMNIRMMVPFSMTCDTCGEYTYVGTKFNSQVEKIKDENYFGCPIFRFYGKCQHCRAVYTFKTDPKTADYHMESGGKKTYEAWKDGDAAIETVKETKEEQASYDAMKALEQASENAASEMAMSDAIENVITINQRGKNQNETIQKALDFLYKKHLENTNLEDEEDSEEFLEELNVFRNDQVNKKRNQLDDEIDETNNDDDDARQKPDFSSGKEDFTKSASSEPSMKRPLSPSCSGSITVKRKIIDQAPPITLGFKVKKKITDDQANTSASGPIIDKALPSSSASSSSSSLQVTPSPAPFGGYESSEESSGL